MMMMPQSHDTAMAQYRTKMSSDLTNGRCCVFMAATSSPVRYVDHLANSYVSVNFF
jgi:hypothetical protein